MKYVKMLALLAVAAAALMAFAGTASATVITSNGSAYTGTIEASAEGHAVLDNPIAKIECASTVAGSIESHGTGVTAKGPISALSFTGCTDSWHVTVVSSGSLEGHYLEGTNVTLTSSGATVEATRFGISCRYATSSTHVGTITGSKNTGGTATFHINASIPFHSGSIFCGSGATAWTGSYSVTSPMNLDVDN